LLKCFHPLVEALIFGETGFKFVKKIFLGKGNRWHRIISDKFALVDDENYDYLNSLTWHLTKDGYASRHLPRPARKIIFMHNLIFPTPKGYVIDHINGDKLDNRKENLRICTHRENLLNAPKSKKRKTTSIYKGVCWIKSHNRWGAHICKDGVDIQIGLFKEERHAALAWDIWARELHGEFANFNFKKAV